MIELENKVYLNITQIENFYQTIFLNNYKLIVFLCNLGVSQHRVKHDVFFE